jgi:pimeloyl-ACP methyl ester carboxylesterase
MRTAAALLVAAATIAGMSAQDMPAVSHEYAEVNGVRLHYAKTGHGPLILFLHGFPEFWYEWKNQLVEFGNDHTAVAPDLRGYNLSSKPSELSAYAVPTLVEDVRQLADRLRGGTKFTLVAHDWGGAVAWVFAAMHPEMLDRLVIINAPHPTVFNRELHENPAQQQASQYMLMFRSPAAEATLSANNYATLATIVGVTGEDKDAYIAAWSQPGALTGGLNYYRASRVGPPQPGEDPSAASSPPLMIRVPTLVIWGEKDTALLTGNLEGLDRYVPSLTVKRIPDATHWVVREKSSEVNLLIRAFLAS